MKLKKKGSALITVILVFGILITVGSAVMTVSLTDVKLRATESKRVQNLYASESGIEETYGILSKYADESIKAGNSAVEAYLHSLYDENGVILVQKAKFINGEDFDGTLLNDRGQVNEEYVKENIRSKFKEVYKVEFAKKIIEIIEKGGYIIGGEDISPRVSIKNLRKEEVFFSKPVNLENQPEELKIIVFSAYDKIDNSGFKNERQIESTFRVSVPEYDAPYSIETETIALSDNIIRGKTLVTNANLELNESSNMILKGESFILGNAEDSNAITGILLKGLSSNLNMTEASVISMGDVRLQGGSSTIESDEKSTLYTGSLSIEKPASGSKIDMKGEVYANNDLVLNGSKSNINILKGFYGINDIRTTTIGEKKRNSSSIIVNTMDIGETDGSSINIGNELVLLGTAYIETENSYQTGESVGIIGNYKAYATALENDEKYKKENIIFDYFKPLMLASKIKDGDKLVDLTLNDKINYFWSYYNNKENGLKLKGITLPDDIYTLGVAISKGNAIEKKFTIDNENIKNRVKAYKDKVSVIKTVEDYINFSAITSTSSQVSNNKEFKEIVYLCNDDKNLVISNADGVSDENTIYLNGKKAKGIIITKGNVSIKGQVDFAGTIISNGTVSVVNQSKVTLNSNKRIVDYLVAKNYDKFLGVFKNDTPNVFSNVELDASAFVEDELQYIPRENLIKTSNWKILK